ncbi:MAG: exonuclease SbcCD subunit D [Thermoleophilia bacterium]
MRLLHTGDWHLGKRLYGLDRRDELRAALSEIAGIGAAQRVDAVVVSGDLLDRRVVDAGPIGDCLSALEELTALGPVVVAVGNHDDPDLWNALAPYLAVRGITVAGRVRGPDESVVSVETGAGPLHVALLPWPDPARLGSDLGVTAQHAKATYADLVGALIGEYAARLRELRTRHGGAAVLVGHLMVDGALAGGGEREMTMGITYAISPAALPADLDYIALGHVHRPQAVPRTASPARYAGSPIPLDFSEDNHAKTACVVEITPERTTVAEHPLTSGRPLARIRGDLDGLAARAAEHPNARFLVEVELDVPVLDLVRRVREVVPDALRVEPRYPQATEPAMLDGAPGAPMRPLADLYEDWYRAMDRALPARQREAFAQAVRDAEGADQP